jgi:hypothetical protein
MALSQIRSDPSKPADASRVLSSMTNHHFRMVGSMTGVPGSSTGSSAGWAKKRHVSL